MILPARLLYRVLSFPGKFRLSRSKLIKPLMHGGTKFRFRSSFETCYQHFDAYFDKMW